MPDRSTSITVGLPVYNDPDSLRNSVPTVLAQSWPGPLRLLIIDDGSTDETPAVIAEFSGRHPNIEVVTHPRNLGRPMARNRILEEAGDDYLAWIDSDDLWHPRKLELQMAALQAEDPTGVQPLICTTPFRWIYHDRGQERVKVPQVEGDQLRNALTGSLHPYLWAMLGRAQVFRDAGGFDERLPRRQDFEFFIRFLTGGGRVIRTEADTPLCTYLKTDIGRSSEEIATANEVIRLKHDPVYRRYGRRFTLEGRRKRHLLVARFQEHNGQRVQAALTRFRAKVLDPIVWLLAPADIPSSLLSNLKRTYWRVRRPIVRTRTSVRRWALAGRRRVLRWIGRVRGHLGASRQLWRDGQPSRAVLRLLWPQDRLSTAVRRAERITGQADATVAIGQMIHLLGEPQPGEHQVWLTLERTFRTEGRLWSAEQALLAGLERSPGDQRLVTSQVELLSLRRDWEGCVERWRELRSTDHASAITFTRVARALRQLGRPAESLTVAATGLGHWPKDARLVEIYHSVRGLTIDWPRSIESIDGPAETPVGRTTSLGFLDAHEGPITGSVRSDGTRGQKVALTVNGVEVATTAAQPSGTDADEGRFSLACDQLAEFLGDGDVLELRTPQGAIRFGEGGVQLRVQTGTPSRAPELLRRIAAGHTFTKFGRLRPGNTPARKARTLDLFDEASDHLRRILPGPCYPFYGNLLGAVREHDFLAHDIGGFDMGYLSEQGDPDAVRREFVELCERLLDTGYHLTLEPYSAMIRRTHNDEVFLDLNFAWVNERGELGMSYGWRYDPVTDIERFRSPRRSAMGDRLVPVPGNAEDVLEQVYGPGWLIPDQGFDLELHLRRDERYLLRDEELTALRDRNPDQVRLSTKDEELA